MKYVYLLQSVEFPDETYVGLIDNLRSRFTARNAGRSPHTAKYKPWRLVIYVAFPAERKAVEFERYLKSVWPGFCQQAFALMTCSATPPARSPAFLYPNQLVRTR